MFKLGDLIAKITKLLGFKQCSGCKKRQEWLNRLTSKGKDNDGNN